MHVNSEERNQVEMTSHFGMRPQRTLQLSEYSMESTGWFNNMTQTRSTTRCKASLLRTKVLESLFAAKIYSIYLKQNAQLESLAPYRFPPIQSLCATLYQSFPLQ